MEDEEPLTYRCKKCGTLIYYTPYEVRENKQLGPVANCPKCGVVIPELAAMRLLSFDIPN